VIEAETGDENAVVNGAVKYHISYIGILRDRFKPDPLRIYFLKSAFTMIDTMLKILCKQRQRLLSYKL